MKLSSSHSDAPTTELFGAVFSRGEASRELGDTAYVRAMLDVERSLARALFRAGLISRAAANAVEEAANVDHFDVRELARDSGGAGSPVPALVRALAGRVPEDAAKAVHFGATSQDVIDTAVMLVTRRALPSILADLRAAANACARLVERHRGALMVGRTLLTPAVPITFGFKAALWLEALEGARTRLSVVAHALPLQFGGAAGTLAVLGNRGLDVRRLLAEELGLVETAVPWHAFRLPVLDLGAALSSVASVLGKIARDASLLAQPEIGEVVFSGESGGSSTLPQKTNPVAAVAVLACTRRVPGLFATLSAVSEQEHERGAGGWHAEWETLRDVLRLVGSASAWGRELVDTLRIDADRMARNLAATNGATLSERIATLLADRLGPIAAHDITRRAAIRARDGRSSLVDALCDDAEGRGALERAGMTRDDVVRALDPATYLGSADAFVDRALDVHRKRLESEGSAR